MSVAPVTAAVLVIGDEILSRPHQGHEHRLHRRIPRADRHRSARGRASCPTSRRRSSPRSTRCGRATTTSSPPAASGRRTTTSPPTRSPRRSASASARIRALSRCCCSASSRRTSTPARRRMARIPARRRARRKRGVEGAGLPDRQRHRHGRRAERHAGDARRCRAEARRRRRDDAARDDRSRRLAGGAYAAALGDVAEAHRSVSIGSYPSFRRRQVPQPDRRARQGRGAGAAARRRSRRCWRASQRA